MKPIQFILIPLLVLLLIVFSRKLRKQVLLKSLFFLIMGVVLVFTVFEESSTVLAHWLGIGRGVDLVLYFGMLGLGVCCLLLYLRMLDLQRSFTELVRQQALWEAQRAGDSSSPAR